MISRRVDRRALLAVAVGLLLGTAGCSGLATGPPDGHPTPTLTPVDVPSPAATDPAPPADRPDRDRSSSPTATRAALYWEDGGDAPTDRVVVVNDAPRTRAVTLVVSRNGTHLVDRTLSVAPDRPVRLVRLAGGTYTVRLAYGDTTATRTYTVPRLDDDAASRTVLVSLAADGEVTTRVIGWSVARATAATGSDG